MKYKIIPTLIASNQKELDNLIDKYKKFYKYFQLDVMDGKFVKNKSNNFNFKLPKNYKYEAHLMINNPEEWIKKNYKYFEVLIANIEKVKDPEKLIKFVKSKKKKIGFALNPETSLITIMPYLKNLEQVLILAVHPGKYGAEFLPKTFEKVDFLRKVYKGNIEIDGHEDPDYMKLLKRKGANYFAIGSYLKDSKNIKDSIKNLNDSLR